MRRYIIAALVVLALLLPLSGCVGGNDAVGGDTEETTQPEEVADLDLYDADGKFDFVLVICDSLSKENKAKVSEIAGKYKSSGIVPKVYDEFDYGDYKPAHAIIFGTLGNKKVIPQERIDFCAAQLAGLKCDDFMIKAHEGNIYVFGGADPGCTAAMDYFAENYIVARSVKENEEYIKRSDYPLSDMTICGVPIGEYTIVYDASRIYTVETAEKIRDLIAKKTGYMLKLRNGSTDELENEIIVGTPKRAVCSEITAQYDRPNVYYDIKASGGKLLVVFQGYRTGNAAYEALEKYLDGLTSESCAVDETRLSVRADIKKTADRNMILRDDGTDLRIMHSNILFANHTDDDVFPTTERQRAELQADTYLVYYPDIITFNEFGDQYEVQTRLLAMLEPYYEFVATQKAYAVKMAIRKGSGITTVETGRESLVKGDSFHTVAWAVCRTADERQFLVVNAHFTENKDKSGNWITDNAQVACGIYGSIRQKYGGMPTIMNGDWYFWPNTVPYNYVISCGFSNASVTAKHRYSSVTGTFYHPSTDIITVEEDICFYRDLTPIAHKILGNNITKKSSDHFPVLVDFAFN